MTGDVPEKHDRETDEMLSQAFSESFDRITASEELKASFLENLPEQPVGTTKPDEE